MFQVLKGEKVNGNIGSGKTLASGPNDNVFVYFTDHGAKVRSYSWRQPNYLLKNQSLNTVRAWWRLERTTSKPRT